MTSAAFDELVAAAFRRLALRRELQRLGARLVHQRLAVEEEHEDRRVRRRFIQLRHRRHSLLLELVRRPAADHPHPLPFRCALRLFANHRESALERLHAVPAQLEVVETTAAHRVQMRVVQTRE